MVKMVLPVLNVDEMFNQIYFFMFLVQISLGVCISLSNHFQSKILTFGLRPLTYKHRRPQPEQLAHAWVCGHMHTHTLYLTMRKDQFQVNLNLHFCTRKSLLICPPVLLMHTQLHCCVRYVIFSPFFRGLLCNIKQPMVSTGSPSLCLGKHCNVNSL